MCFESATMISISSMHVLLIVNISLMHMWQSQVENEHYSL